MKKFSVLTLNSVDTTTSVKDFNTKKEALDYIAKLSEDFQMVTLRNNFKK